MTSPLSVHPLYSRRQNHDGTGLIGSAHYRTCVPDARNSEALRKHKCLRVEEESECVFFFGVHGNMRKWCEEPLGAWEAHLPSVMVTDTKTGDLTSNIARARQNMSC